MSFEVEIKFRNVDHARLRARLERLGAIARPTIAQEDTYLAHPARDFAETREALRLRRIGLENRITYKGPRHAGPTKTREEIEIAAADGPEGADQLARLFAVLGFTPVATVRKLRTSFQLPAGERPHAVEISLDHAEGLGDYAEIEILVENEPELPSAQAAVMALASEFGLTDVEPRSYLRMLLESRDRGPGGARV